MTKTRNQRSKPSGKVSRGRSAKKVTSAKGTDNTSSDAADVTAAGKATKLGLLTSLLGRPDGAFIAELARATGWQPHSVRGAMSGSLKRKGLNVTSDVTDGARRYRIGAPE